VIVSSVESVPICRSASSPSSAGVREAPRSCHHRRCSVVTSPRWTGVSSEVTSRQSSLDAASAREATTSGVRRPNAATNASAFDGTALTERSQMALTPLASRRPAGRRLEEPPAQAIGSKAYDRLDQLVPVGRIRRTLDARLRRDRGRNGRCHGATVTLRRLVNAGRGSRSLRDLRPAAKRL
jgi:hypothetical protein